MTNNHNNTLTRLVDKHMSAEGFYYYRELAETLGIHRGTLALKLSNPGMFTVNELRRLIHALRIPAEEIISLFELGADEPE